MRSSAGTAWMIAIGGFFGAIAVGIGVAGLSALWINANEPDMNRSAVNPSTSLHLEHG